MRPTLSIIPCGTLPPKFNCTRLSNAIPFLSNCIIFYTWVLINKWLCCSWHVLYIYMQLPHVGDSSYIHMLFQSHSDKQYNCRHILKCVTRTLLAFVSKNWTMHWYYYYSSCLDKNIIKPGQGIPRTSTRLWEFQNKIFSFLLCHSSSSLSPIKRTL